MPDDVRCENFGFFGSFLVRKVKLHLSALLSDDVSVM